MTNILNTELVDAAQQGDLARVQAMLEQGADANDDEGIAFVMAVANNHVEVVDILYPLVDNQARVRALEIASWNDLPQMVDYLYQQDHAQQAIYAMINSPQGGRGSELLREKLASKRGGDTQSHINRRTFN